MSATQNVSTRGATSVEQENPETSAAPEGRSRDREPVLVPAVDIFEEAHQISVQADRNSLRIEGEVALDLAAGMSALYADLRSTRYRRSFVLSGELDAAQIEASLTDGLLTVRIPKRI